MKHFLSVIIFILFFVTIISAQTNNSVLQIEEGYIDAHGVLIYYKAFGNGAPLFIVHGGPGASHDYFLPYLIPLARNNRLIFIDERGSGKSQKLEDISAYTVANMVEDVEAVRQALNLGKINLLGHSYGGCACSGLCIKNIRKNLNRLILCSTFHSTKKMNEVFNKMKENMTPELRNKINSLEKSRIIRHWKRLRKTTLFSRIYDFRMGRRLFSLPLSEPSRCEL